jgi:hypothetical protein
VTPLTELDHPHTALENEEFVIVWNFSVLHEHILYEDPALDVSVCPLSMIGREVDLEPSRKRLVHLGSVSRLFLGNEEIESRTVICLDDERVGKAVEVNQLRILDDRPQRYEIPFPDLLLDVLAHPPFVTGYHDEVASLKNFIGLNELVERFWKDKQSNMPVPIVVISNYGYVDWCNNLHRATDKLEKLPPHKFPRALCETNSTASLDAAARCECLPTTCPTILDRSVMTVKDRHSESNFNVRNALTKSVKNRFRAAVFRS